MNRAGRSRFRAARRVLAAVLDFLLAGAATVRGITLPSRVYSTLDGLPGNRVHAIARDSSGYLWFATDRGLARFDGARFSVYGATDGLSPGEVDGVAETKDGALWIAADAGVFRLGPAASRGGAGSAPPFSRLRFVGSSKSEPEPVVVEPRGDSGVRVGTTDGVWESRRGSLVRASPALPRKIWDDHAVASLAETAAGKWTGTLDALWLEPRGGGAPRRFELPGVDRVTAILEDSLGRLWIGTWGGLFRVDANAAGAPLGERSRVSGERISAILERRDGTIVAAALHALIEFPPGERPIRVPAAELGPLFEDVELRCLAEDPAGNLWIGTAGGGAIRLDREGFVRYGREDGLASTQIAAVFARRDGTPCAELKPEGSIEVACFDGQRFRSVRPRIGREPLDTGWGASQLALEDSAGRLWIPTGEGLFRFPPLPRFEALARTPPERTFDRRDGLAVDAIFRLFAARSGEIWISTVSRSLNGLARWIPGGDRVEPLADGEGPPGPTLVTAFGESAGGALWIGTNGGGLWRRRHGRFEPVAGPATAGLSRCWINDVYGDRRGRLWISTDREGLWVFDAPDAPAPRPRPVTAEGAFTSREVRGLAEDRFGRTYALTSSGVDRFDEGGNVERFTAADGLPGGALVAIREDDEGRIWVSGDGGISVLRPLPAAPSPAAKVVFDELDVSGERVPMPLRGRSRVTGLAFPAGHDSLRFAIASLAWEARRPISHRYRLDARSAWAPVPADGAIVLPRLASGRYRLEVGSVGPAGAIGESAVAEFSIAAPVWRRAWFLLAVGAAIAAAAVLLYRMRIEELMRIERIRTRIAADLHDDIGAGLSEVSILTEVVRRRVARDPESESLLGEVAQTARQLVDSMGEIVWAIDPRRDDLASLIARLRHFSGTLAEARGIAFTLETSPDAARVSLDAGRRRDLYLLLKEAAHNALRHAGARRVEMRIAVARGVLRGEVLDDGRGFDPATARNGHGLESMRERAKALGGELDLASAPGSGTRITISVPVGRGPA